MNRADASPLDAIELEPELLGQLGEMTNRIHQPVRLAAVPAHLVDAILAAEDRRFFDHGGVDARAAPARLGQRPVGPGVQGGSRLTQQLIKMGPQHAAIVGLRSSASSRAGVLVALDPTTAEMRALVGGRDDEVSCSTPSARRPRSSQRGRSVS